MALAGWCGSCGSYVWVRPDGGCANGHEAAAVSNLYEVAPPPAEAATELAAPTPASDVEAGSAPVAGPGEAEPASATGSPGDGDATAAAPTGAGPVAAPLGDEPAPTPDLPPGSRVRYDPDVDAVLMPAADLAAFVAPGGVGPGPLAPPLAADQSPDAAAAPAGRSGRAAEIVTGAVAALAEPPRSAVAQLAVADESVSRLTLAWSAARDRVAVVAGRGPDALVALRSPDEVLALLAGAVGLEGVFEPLDVRVDVPPRGALAWVALADTLRRARLQAMLAHGAPSDTCTAADVVATLAGAGAEDFRWALNMLDKVLPDGRAALGDPAAMAEALDGLVAAGVLDVVPADADWPALYGLADIGTAAFDAWTHEIARLAMTVRGRAVDGGGRGDGGPALHGVAAETVLLVRDARRLWLVDIAADRGAIACLGRHAAEGVLRALAGVELPTAARSPVASPAVPSPAEASPAAGPTAAGRAAAARAG